MSVPAMKAETTMAFPFVPFAAGVAVGSLVTYACKDRSVHDYLAREMRQLYCMMVKRVTAIREAAIQFSAPRLRVPEELRSLSQGVQETIAGSGPAQGGLAGRLQNMTDSATYDRLDAADDATHAAAAVPGRRAT
jgi:hypothetical protein